MNILLLHIFMIDFCMSVLMFSYNYGIIVSPQHETVFFQMLKDVLIGCYVKVGIGRVVFYTKHFQGDFCESYKNRKDPNENGISEVFLYKCAIPGKLELILQQSNSFRKRNDNGLEKTEFPFT